MPPSEYIGRWDLAFLKARTSSVYFELSLTGLRIETQKALPLVYRDVTVRCAYRADIIVEDAVVLEVKAIDRIAPIHSRQLYTYLRVADYRVGLVLNFSAPTMLDGIKRVVNNFP